jgi:hypothetical protein
MGGRIRIHKTAVAIIVLITSCLAHRGLSSVVHQRVRTGTLAMSQDCAPQRSRQHLVRVKDISLVCDSEGEDSTYTNSVTCHAGDRAKLAIDCTYLLTFLYQSTCEIDHTHSCIHFTSIPSGHHLPLRLWL